MPEDKGNVVATLLNEINSLKQRVNTLEAWLGVTHPRTAREATMYGIPSTYNELNETPVIPTIRSGAINDTYYAVIDDNITIPLTSTSGYYGTTAYCTSSHS